MTEPQPSSATLPEREGENGKGRFKVVHDVNKEINDLFEATYQRPRGSLIKHGEIEKITGYEKMVVDSKRRYVPSAAYQKIVRKWRRKLLESTFGGKKCPGVATIASNGVGYRFATVEEQGKSVPDNYEKQAVRKTKQAQTTVECIPEEEMTDDQKRFRRERIRQTNESLDISKSHFEERKSFLSNPDTLPRWNGNTI